MKIAAISSTLYAQYAFCLPITCALWSKVCGYYPMAVLVGSEDEWKESRHGRIVLEALREVLNGNIGCIEFVSGVPDRFQDSTVAQSVRQHVAALNYLNEEDIIGTGDADLWPLERDFHNLHDVSRFPIGLYYANGYGDDYREKKHFPTCTQSMTVKTWREVMRLKVSDDNDLGKVITESFEASGLDGKEGMAVWFHDEHHSSKMIVASHHYPDGVQFIEREGHPPKTRLDRGPDKKLEDGSFISSWWPEDPKAAGKIDAHLPRPPFSDRYWPSCLSLLRQVCPDIADMADEYRQKFVEAL